MPRLDWAAPTTPLTDAERRYSEWTVATHDTPDNTADIDMILNLIGKPGQIDDIHDTNMQAANVGNVPFDLAFSDPTYWMGVTLQSRCDMMGDTCGMTPTTDAPARTDLGPDLVRVPTDVKLALKVKADNKSPILYTDTKNGEVILSSKYGGTANCRGGYTATANNLESSDIFVIYNTLLYGKLTSPDGCNKTAFGSKAAATGCTTTFTGFKHIYAYARATASAWWN